MQGLLLVDKPKTWTSFDVVNYIRRIVAAHENKKPKNVKVGHTGTLDPLATGLLVILVGKEYTRRATEWSKLDKTYEVVMKLGETSTTADEEGEKTKISDEKPAREAIEMALVKFTGEIMQTPPIYSAMKVGGIRAYKLARQGHEVVIEPRPAKIYSNALTDYEYPYIRFTSKVSSGTYIRSLVEDLGRELGSGAFMSDLRRTQIGDLSILGAVSVENLDVAKITEKLLTL